MTDEIVLPAKLTILYGLLEKGEEIHVLNLFRHTLGYETENQRHAQQVIGSYIGKLNRRLKGARKRIEPGSLKGTYQMTST